MTVEMAMAMLDAYGNACDACDNGHGNGNGWMMGSGVLIMNIMNILKFKKCLYGGDLNSEQWFG